MARGYPDFSGAIAFPTRKHFRVQDCLVAAVNVGFTEAVFAINNQARIEGGYLCIAGGTNLIGIRIGVQIDGEIIGMNDLVSMIRYNVYGDQSHPLLISRYDPDEYWCTVQIIKDYYLGYEYMLYVDNGTAFILNVIGELWYSDVN